MNQIAEYGGLVEAGKCLLFAMPLLRYLFEYFRQYKFLGKWPLLS